MLIDGKTLAGEIVAGVAAEAVLLPTPPHLTVFTCSPNFETQKFLALKKKQSLAAGITLEVLELPESVNLADVETAIKATASTTDGIIIQLPFPTHLATADLIALIPTSHDVDVFSYDATNVELLPPVVGAIDEISMAHGVAWEGKQVVVVGQGRLVGDPAARYASRRGGLVTIVTKDSLNQTAVIKSADILILGAGVPGLITPAMVKSGVIVFDAGTSEEGGVLVGDALLAVADQASLFTPVPGGIGPLTIAILLKNVLYLAKRSR